MNEDLLGYEFDGCDGSRWRVVGDWLNMDGYVSVQMIDPPFDRSVRVASQVRRAKAIELQQAQSGDAD